MKKLSLLVILLFSGLSVQGFYNPFNLNIHRIKGFWERNSKPLRLLRAPGSTDREIFFFKLDKLKSEFNEELKQHDSCLVKKKKYKTMATNSIRKNEELKKQLVKINKENKKLKNQITVMENTQIGDLYDDRYTDRGILEIGSFAINLFN